MFETRFFTSTGTNCSHSVVERISVNPDCKGVVIIGFSGGGSENPVFNTDPNTLPKSVYNSVLNEWSSDFFDSKPIVDWKYLGDGKGLSHTELTFRGKAQFTLMVTFY